MTKLPTWEQIADELDGQVGYLARRCAVAEGHAPDDLDALREIMGAAQDAAREKVGAARV
jgi:hypothetical protein